MRLRASLFLIALGAILRFAVSEQMRGVDLQAVGLILMIVGVLGLLVETVLWVSRRQTDVLLEDNRRAQDPYGTPRY